MTVKVSYLDPDRGVRTLTAADINALVLALTQGTIDGVAIGGATPAAGAFTTLSASGAAALAALAATTIVASGKVTLGSVGNALVAAGTTRADALQLVNQTNQLGTVASGTGAILPAAAVGDVCFVFNAGASAAKIYGAGSDTIDGAAAATGVTLTNAKRAMFICVAAATWISAQLGVVAA